MCPNPVPSLSPPSGASSIHTPIPTPTSSSILASQASSVHTPIFTPASSTILPAQLSAPSLTFLPSTPITPLGVFRYPNPSSTTASETQPLLQYPVTTYGHSSIHSSENPSITNSEDIDRASTLNINPLTNAQNRRRKVNCLALIFCAVSLAASLVGITIIVVAKNHGKNQNKKVNIESSEHYDSTMFLHTHNITRAPSLTSMTHAEPSEPPQLRGIDFAILCLVIFFVSAMVRVVSYLMSKWGFCFGGDGSEISEDCFSDEVERYEGRKIMAVEHMV
ncbi:hypothetical protein EAF04_006580 [Stromatinia cepivora]|nr:hypothetical protein EAF04_006580 [Stromatinia cepivora]